MFQSRLYRLVISQLREGFNVSKQIQGRAVADPALEKKVLIIHYLLWITIEPPSNSVVS